MIDLTYIRGFYPPQISNNGKKTVIFTIFHRKNCHIHNFSIKKLSYSQFFDEKPSYSQKLCGNG